MERAVKQFAQRIVVIHLALFVGVLIVVLFAARAMYRTARAESAREAERRQRLLAQQTADGIEHFYGSILSDLRLLRRADVEGPDREVALPFGGGRFRIPLPRGLWFAPLIAEQLQGRASQVILLDRDTREARVLSRADPRLPPERVVEEMAQWIETVDRPSVSPFRRIGGEGINLVAMPLGARQRKVLVAVVPVRHIDSLFLRKLNERDTAGAFLTDEGLTVMTTSRKKLVGTDATRMGDESVLRALEEWSRAGFVGTKYFYEPLKLGFEQWEPSMVTAEPVPVAGTGAPAWHLFVATRLSDVDAAVTGLYRHMVLWTAFIVIAMSGILASTAVQLIRGRMRTERARREMLERELNEARQIQLAWLPTGTLERPTVDVAALNQPARHISGDFYNWFELPDGRVAVAIGDVTGHGMSAAFLMATTQLLVRNTLPRCREPGHCLQEVNRQLCAQTFNGQFVTMQVAVIDPETGQIDIANAGHLPPLVRGEGNEGFYQLPVEPQLALGIEPDTTYPTERFDLPPQPSLLFYTDGVVEAEAADGRRLNFDGLVERLARTSRPERARQLVEFVVEAVNAFRGERALDDDLTVVAVQLQPSPAPTEGEPTLEAAVS
jgi:serine phosphatase RsbU (regulator of sigma subunit)